MSATLTAPERALPAGPQPSLAVAHWEESTRWAELPTREFLIPDLLPIGATLLIAGPKTGKSWFAQQIEHEIAHGRAFSGFPTRQPTDCLVIDLEGDQSIVAQRSLHLAPRGYLEGEYSDAPMPADSWRIAYFHAWEAPGGFAGRVHALDAYLTEAAAAGRPVRYVRIDTMRLFVGANSKSQNAYDFDAGNMAAINRLALKHNAAILLCHHLKKDGGEGDWVERASGSMGTAGSVTALLYLQRARGGDTGVLHMTSRVAPDAAHPMRFVEGRWEFADDLSTEEAAHSGIPRRVINFLKKVAAATAQEILSALGCPRSTLDSALNRLSHQYGIVEYAHGLWRLRRDIEKWNRGEWSPAPTNPGGEPKDSDPAGAGEPPINTAPAGAQVERGIPEPPPGRTEHPSTDRGQNQQTDETDSGEWEEISDVSYETSADASAEASRELARAALRALQTSITGISPTYHVRLRVPDAERTAEPWSLADVICDGRHSWEAPTLPKNGRYVVLDRNGSYPSAASSVPVAPNLLTHTGPVQYDTDRAGLYLIRVPKWPYIRHIGHPLGVAAAEAERGEVWVTDPHMRLLIKLAKAGAISPIEILDSWTGRAHTSLFTGFGAWARELRAQTRGTDDYTAGKVAVSRAIRLVWASQSQKRSLIWRPDWWHAWVSEANVRHWAVGYRAHTEYGHKLLSMRNTDEVTILAPTDVDATWCPEPYKLDTKDTGAYGLVTIEETGTIAAYRAKR